MTGRLGAPKHQQNRRPQRAQTTQLNWDLSSHEEQQRKIMKFKNGETDGADIPPDVKARVTDKRSVGKIALLILFGTLACLLLA